MREITDYAYGDHQSQLFATDQPGPGGANHEYMIVLCGSSYITVNLMFQRGGIAEAGVNGITNEVLLAIVIDRLAAFDAGPFPSQENALALANCQQALAQLNQRTFDRINRGVEGKTVA